MVQAAEHTFFQTGHRAEDGQTVKASPLKNRVLILIQTCDYLGRRWKNACVSLSRMTVI